MICLAASKPYRLISPSKRLSRHQTWDSMDPSKSGDLSGLFCAATKNQETGHTFAVAGHAPVCLRLTRGSRPRSAIARLRIFHSNGRAGRRESQAKGPPGLAYLAHGLDPGCRGTHPTSRTRNRFSESLVASNRHSIVPCLAQQFPSCPKNSASLTLSAYMMSDRDFADGRPRRAIAGCTREAGNGRPLQEAGAGTIAECRS